MINVNFIHDVENRVLTLAECDELLDERRKKGRDLSPEYIKEEQERFFKSLRS